MDCRRPGRARGNETRASRTTFLAAAGHGAPGRRCTGYWMAAEPFAASGVHRSAAPQIDSCPTVRRRSELPGPIAGWNPDGVFDSERFICSLGRFHGSTANSRGGWPAAWSPDGRFVLTYRSNELIKVPLAGGTEQIIASNLVNFRGAAWTIEKTILYSEGGPLLRISENGGTPDRLTSIAAWSPTMLPDGRHTCS